LLGTNFDHKVQNGYLRLDEAEKFHVARAWNETIREIMFIEPDHEHLDSNYGFKIETYSTIGRGQAPGYCYIMCVPLDVLKMSSPPPLSPRPPQWSNG
jgi:hypothetical protein